MTRPTRSNTCTRVVLFVLATLSLSFIDLPSLSFSQMNSLPIEDVGQAHVGSIATGGTLVATDQIVGTAGQTVAFAGRPIDLVLAPDGDTVYVKDDRGLVVLDARTWQVRQELPAKGGTSLHGIALSRDGSRIYLTTADSQILEAGITAAGKWDWRRTISLPGAKPKGSSYPCGIGLSPDGKRAYVCLSRSNSLAVVDLEAGKMIAEMPVGIAPYGVVLTQGGSTAYVTDWGGRRAQSGERSAASSGTEALIDVRGVGSSGCVSVVSLLRGETQQIATGLHPSDLTLSADDGRLYVTNANSDTVSIIDTAARAVIETVSIRPSRNLPFGSMPNALALSKDGSTLFVANGGNNALAVVTLDHSGANSSRVTGFIPTDWYPGGVAVDAKNIYVCNIKGTGSRGLKSAESQVSVSSLKPVDRQSTTANGSGRKNPVGKQNVKQPVNSQKRLTTPKKRQKEQPKDKLKVPHPVPPAMKHNVYEYTGTISRISLPNATELKDYTRRSLANSRVPQILRERALYANFIGTPVPVPRSLGEPSVFKHVLYIIKENRTYDQIFGDTGRGNSDPRLTLFGRKITPNHHAIAEQFVLLDNFYCNGVLSADGHSWATEGNCTDHLEKAFGGFTRSYTFGDDPLTYSSSGFLWDNALAHGRTFRNYGEMDYTHESPDVDYTHIYKEFLNHTHTLTYKHTIGIENLRRFSCPDAPGWNMDIPDVMRAEIFLRELKGFEESGNLPNLTILYLPNDHTSGTTPGDPTPAAYLADNDLALGRVVAGISRSRFWKDTCIFVDEDDPQDGFDHVDGHRSPCLVVSPYTKRGAVVSQFYNQTSVLHTIERILGLPPMNQMDALAPLMTACFTDKPDLRPYSCLPNRIPLGTVNPKLAPVIVPKQSTRKGTSERKSLSKLEMKRQRAARDWARKSASLRFDKPDIADADTLNRVLWAAMKGDSIPYPARYAGSHGMGLKALKLRLGQGSSARDRGD